MEKYGEYNLYEDKSDIIVLVNFDVGVFSII